METPTKRTFVNAGVYVEEYKAVPIHGAGTSTAAFIGAAKNGPYNTPVIVKSFQEFERAFGGHITAPRQYLAYAVDLFFKNGGSSAYIVRAAELPVVRSLQKLSVSVGKLQPAAVYKADDGPAPALDLDAALAALEKADDASIIAAPGLYGKDIYEKLIAHCCKMRYRFAILDLPRGCSAEEAKTIRRAEMASPEGIAATYYPWPQITDPVTKEKVSVPPSGAVAGVYAAVDTYTGVHKAPANVSLESVIGLETNIDMQQQELLSTNGICAIRAFSGKGFLVWGAITISERPEWRHISTRRLMQYLEKSIYNGTQWAVSQPNDAKLWVVVRTSVEEFLMNIWRAGGLAGAKPEEAFYVRCGLGVTMTAEDILKGIMIVDIGAAVLRPGEFYRFTIVWQCK